MEGSLTAVIPVSGRGFVLLADGEIDWLLSGWGRVFATLADSHTQVPRVTWSLISRPAGVDGHVAWAAAGDADPVYLDYATSFGVTCHEIVVTVTVLIGRGRTAVGDGFVRLDTAVTLVGAALTDARLDHSGACSIGGLAALVRAGFDSTSLTGATATGSLVDRLGLVPVGVAGPLSATVTPDRVDIDGSSHRTFWVGSWPELPQGGDWFEPLAATLADGLRQRTVTVIVEPVPTGKAMAEINRDVTRHGADAVAAAQGHGRIDARGRARATAVLERDNELAAGFTACTYAGFVTVTVARGDDLDRVCGDVVARFARARVELRVLWGRMDRAFAAGMPLGLGVSRTEPR